MTRTPDGNIPRRRVVPLAPPAGRFEGVLMAARARRRQRGLVASGTVAVASVPPGQIIDAKVIPPDPLVLDCLGWDTNPHGRFAMPPADATAAPWCDQHHRHS